MPVAEKSSCATVPPSLCLHDDRKLVYRRNGKLKNYLFQCQDCGQELPDPAELTTVLDRIEATEIDWKLRSSGVQLDWKQSREDRSEAWQLRYKKHLASPEWQELRRRVLFRCQGICEGCRKSPAVHVHHLNYDRMGNEMLFDLVGVCRECHQNIHPDKDLT